MPTRAIDSRESGQARGDRTRHPATERTGRIVRDVTSSGGPDPRGIVRLELARTALSVATVPWRVLAFLVRRGALRREIASDLKQPAPIDASPSHRRSSRPLRVFLSCAEPSGELHAFNFLRALKSMEPDVIVAGLGSQRFADAGIATLADPVQHATMGFRGVLGSLPFYVGLLERSAAHFRDARPDVAVLVDSPALHVPLGRIARKYGVPVLHFVTPQHWAWAPWRASGYGRAVDRALTILPFERAWFARRGVPVAHVGHPLLDELASVPRARDPEASSTIAVLPGSRRGVIDLNLPWMLDVLKALRIERPELNVAIVQASDRHVERIEGHIARAGAGQWVRVEAGDLHGSLSRARAAFSVSGTVLLDVLHHRLPTVCIYRVANRRGVLIYQHALITPFFASINLLSAREVVPEFCFCGRGPFEAVLRALERSYSDADYRRETIRALDVAADRLGPPGASQRAALHALDLATRAG